MGRRKGDRRQGGMKHDLGKLQMELLSGTWIEGVASVLTFGARKYAAHNWRGGISQSRLLGAAFRHLFRYLAGEDLDPETGLPHPYHASCCLMFLSELRLTRPDLDDRYNVIKIMKEIQDGQIRNKKRGRRVEGKHARRVASSRNARKNRR